MKRIILVVQICLTFSFFTQGSIFRNYQVEHGLSHNSVWTVMQDSEGFMWFGTKDGLNRFDGVEFKIYKNSQEDSLSIGHNFIHCIKEDSKNRLLIGTRNGVYQYNREFDNFKHIRIDKKNGQDVNVNDIMEDLQGNIWVACHGNGLYRLNNNLEVEKHYIADDKDGSIPMNFIWSIITDHYGNLWLGTAGMGLVHFDFRNEKFTSINNREKLDINNQSIYSIYSDDENILWIGTSTKGLYKYNPINGETSQFINNTTNVKSIKKYSDNELIMGSDMGLIILNKKTKKHNFIREEYSDDYVTNNSIFSIAVDKEGSVWIGSYFEGVKYYSPSINNFFYFNSISWNSKQKYIVSGIEEDLNGNMLIGTHNNNIIYRFDPKEKSLKKAYEMDYHNIQSLLRVKDKLYVSIYERGIYVLSLSSGKVIDRININTLEGKSFFKLSNNRVFITLEAGGYSYINEDGKIIRTNNLDKILIAEIAEDIDGTIWFATYNQGLFSLNKDGKIEKYAANSKSNHHFLSNNLTSIVCDSNKYLWIGTNDKGLIQFDPVQNKVIKTYNESNGLPSNHIYFIINDHKKNLWVSTNLGVVKISTQTEELKSLGYVAKEIQNNTKSVFRSSSNQIYFGGANGFIVLNPDKLITNESIPTVSLTGLKLFNKEVLPGEKSSPLKYSLSNSKEVILKNHQSNFSIKFSALSYIFPEINQYAYMLEGFDNDWIYTNENTANYMNIKPGKYVFRVKGSNNDGVWNNQDTQVIIRIKPHVLLANYMIFLYVLMTIGITILFIRRYHRFVESKNQEKQYKYQVIKDKELYETKIEFFTHMAHEIRTPLSLITAPLESIIVSDDGTEQTKQKLNTIQRNAGRLLVLVNQLLDFRKIESEMLTLNLRYQDVVKIIQKVYNQYIEEAKSNKIDIYLELPEKPVLSYIDQEALYKIISNFISNALKFTKDQVKIKLTMNENDELLYLSVEDNGIGIENHSIEKIFEPFYQIQVLDNFNNRGSGIGLSLSKSLAKKLGGDILVHSEYGNGSKFTLELPVLRNGVDTNIEEENNEITFFNPEEHVEKSESEITILIAEDNDELRTFMKESLTEHYKVLDAENGVKALQIIENNLVDIVISDILMPEMDGLEFCNKLKSDSAYSHLPLILLSALTDTPTKVAGLKKGADVYMEKPFSIEQLKAQVSSIMENRNKIRKKFIESPLQYYKRNPDNSENAEFIKKLNAFILENMSDDKFSIENLSYEFAISRTNFQKKIKNITGLTPNDYIKLIRLNKSAELLSTGKYRINEVCFLVGFNTPSYFSKCFYEQFGKLPKDFIQTSN